MNNTSYKIAFFGTPELTLPVLDALSGSEFTPQLIVTNPDRPVGRNKTITPPATKQWAANHNITVFQPENLDDGAYDELSKTEWDLFIVVAYGKIMPTRFIELPKFGTLNLHYSILPRWRGASPVESAILHGDPSTGVAIQQMVYELDAGDLVAFEEYPLNGTEVTPELQITLSEIGGRLLIETLPKLFTGEITPEPQVGEITKCWKTKKSDGEISLHDPEIEKWRKYRAYYGWPGVFFFDTNHKRIKITEAVFENETFVIRHVIPEGKNEMSFEQFTSK